MKHFYPLLFSILLLYNCSNDNKESNSKAVTKIYKPGFGELMTSIQIHHEKLWFAGKNANWKLTEFEIQEITENFEQIEDFQTERKESKEIKMVYPYLVKILEDVKKKDSVSFTNDYLELTKNCNTCHKNTGYTFIKIKKPDINTFSNQVFK